MKWNEITLLFTLLLQYVTNRYYKIRVLQICRNIWNSEQTLLHPMKMSKEENFCTKSSNMKFMKKNHSFSYLYMLRNYCHVVIILIRRKKNAEILRKMNENVEQSAGMPPIRKFHYVKNFRKTYVRNNNNNNKN